MLKPFMIVCTLVLLGFSQSSHALNEFEAEDLADITAVFVYLKNHCGYKQLPNSQIRQALLLFSHQNGWDLSNYDQFNMKEMGKSSYQDLSNIALPEKTKCQALARGSLNLLAWAN